MVERRDFGLVTARIDDDSRRVVLAFAPRKPGKLDDKTRQACVRWALGRLKDLEAEGYIIDSSAVKKSINQV